MQRHNPPHTVKFIRYVYIKAFDVSYRKVANKLNVSPSTFTRLINGGSNVTPEMALRLSKILGRSPESWLAMQDLYDLWRATKKVNLRKVEKLDLSVF
jgi:addiction module HigA family antidote